MYPSATPQHFSVTVRFEGVREQWAFERSLSVSMAVPSLASMGRLHFSQAGLPMEPAEAILMRLVSARWSLSPQRGREDWRP
eukprot:1017744-Prymnesium_polylepis.1